MKIDATKRCPQCGQPMPMLETQIAPAPPRYRGKWKICASDVEAMHNKGLSVVKIRDQIRQTSPFPKISLTEIKYILRRLGYHTELEPPKNHFKDIWQDVLKKRREGQSFAQIGRQYNVSIERARQIFYKAERHERWIIRYGSSSQDEPI